VVCWFSLQIRIFTVLSMALRSSLTSSLWVRRNI
jgi:hypothetical protein